MSKLSSSPLGKKVKEAKAPVVTTGEYDPDDDGDNDALPHDEADEKSSNKKSSHKGVPGRQIGKARNTGPKGPLAGANPMGSDGASDEAASTGPAAGTEVDEPVLKRIQGYNKGKPAGRQIKDPFKMAGTIKRLKAGR